MFLSWSSCLNGVEQRGAGRRREHSEPTMLADPAVSWSLNCNGTMAAQGLVNLPRMTCEWWGGSVTPQ